MSQARYPSADRANPQHSYLRLLQMGLAKPLHCWGAGSLLHYRFSFSLTAYAAAGVFFSAALSVGSGFGNNSCQIPSFRLAVSQHPALWSPDFPHGTCYNIAIVEVVPRSHPARFACVLYHMHECCVAGDALQGTPYGTYEWHALQLVQARRAGILQSVRARFYFYPRLLIFLIFCLLNAKNCATLTLVYVTYCRSVPCQIQPQLKAMPQATAPSMLAKSKNKPNKNSSRALIWRHMLSLWLCFMAYFSFLQ